MSPTSYQLLYSAVLRVAKVRIIFESANFFQTFPFPLRRSRPETAVTGQRIPDAATLPEEGQDAGNIVLGEGALFAGGQVLDADGTGRRLVTAVD